MTIEEIKKAKRDLERKLCEDIAAFRSATGFVVTEVDLIRYEYRTFDSTTTYVGEVRVKVDLGV